MLAYKSEQLHTCSLTIHPPLKTLGVTSINHNWGENKIQRSLKQIPGGCKSGTNIITRRAISRGLNHQGIPVSTKITEAQDKLGLMLTSIRLQISLTLAQNSLQAMNWPILC